MPESVNDGALLLSDMIVLPVPSLGVDRLADSTQHSEGAEIVVLDVVFTETAEEADSGGGGVELGNLMFLNGLPVAGWGRVNWSGLEDGGGDTVEKGTIDNVTDEMLRLKEMLMVKMRLTCDR